MSWQEIGLALAAAWCAGLAKGGFGGAGMLAVLLMAWIFPARESTGVLLPMLITADLVAVALFHAHARAGVILRLLPPSAIGIVAGWWMMPRVPAESFGRLIGWLVLGLLVMVVMQRRFPGLLQAVERKRFAWPIGGLAGVTTMLANAAGPVTTIYLLACRLPKMEFVGTSAWFFLAVNLAKVPFSVSLGLITPSSLLLNASLAPVVIFGVLAGRWLLRYVNQTTFEWLMLGFSFLGALRLALG